MNLYSVKDELAEEFAPLFYAKNDAVAKRMYLEMCKQSRLDPSDFTLYHVLDLDESVGLVTWNSPYVVDIEIPVKQCIDGKEVVNV